MKCEICQAEMKSKPFIAKEMQFSMLHTFEYIECEHCGCVQICKIPDNISDYYPASRYYSYQARYTKASLIKNKLRRHLFKYRMGDCDTIGYLQAKTIRKNDFFWMGPEINFNSKILDVGCGSGSLLMSLHQGGFRQCCGVDPFIEKDTYYNDGLTILKRSVFEVEGTFDFIMLHHSFEHMAQQREVLEYLKKLLNKKGTILVRIPCACDTYQQYKENYFHLDAPRHFFLHSLKSFEKLCSSCGLKIDRYYFDTLVNSILGSERYANQHYGAFDISEFSKSHIRKVAKETKRRDKMGRGDTVAFYLQIEH